MRKYYKILTALLLVVLSISLIGCNKAVSTEYDSYKTARKNLFTQLNEQLEEGKVFFVGDSITEGFEVSELIGTNAINRGISGDTSDRLCERFFDNVLSAKPSKIFMLIGTNDIVRGIEKKDIVENILKAIHIRDEKSPQSELYILSVLPVNYSLLPSMVGSRKNDNIKVLNAEIAKSLAGTNSTFIDVFDSFLDDNGNMSAVYSYDGLHLSYNGYVNLADTLKKYI